MQVKLDPSAKKAIVTFNDPLEVATHYQSHILQTGFYLPAGEALPLFETIDLILAFLPLKEKIDLKAQVVRIVDEGEAQKTGQAKGIALYLMNLTQAHLKQILTWSNASVQPLDRVDAEDVSGMDQEPGDTDDFSMKESESMPDFATQDQIEGSEGFDDGQV